MGSCCGYGQKPEPTDVLESAKLLEKTKTGKTINRKIRQKFDTKKDRQMFMETHFDLKPIFSDKYSNFTKITPNVFLTGIGGIIEENIRKYDIKCIVNVTFEFRDYQIKGIESIRVPLEDEKWENISEYFDPVVNQMDKWVSNGQNIVVHCMCGVSRSATLVIAYLMKYKGMTLKVAFIHVRERRPVIRPNISFFRQLIDYEKKIFKKNSVKIIKQTNERGETFEIPDFFVKQYPEETESEADTTGRTTDSTIGDTIYSADTSGTYSSNI